ncbi:BON domain-containing protein [Nonomuraea phyllanthi]|nr:BON domain-containing protein [Nonomuraea phyllanthi]
MVRQQSQYATIGLPSEPIVTLSGWMQRRTEAAIAVRMAGRVNGVVGVVGRLAWRQDDSQWEAG